jgi:SagB-type dehydrogenase family enzyme
MNRDTIGAVAAYHHRTKHDFDRYARSPGYMDWANQPDPFRRYNGTETLALPFLDADPEADHAALYRSSLQPEPFGLETVAGFLELSVGLSAWKAYGNSRWSLRMNPSSGNLHPTETHLLMPPMPGIEPGVYHYRVIEHALELRAVPEPETWQGIRNHMGGNGFLVGLTTIFWREAWKYGERAFRYCNHDVGHALAALRFSAGLFGWRLFLLGGMSDRDIEILLGLDRTPWHPGEEEHPDLVAFVCATGDPPCARELPETVLERFASAPYIGKPAPLSRRTRRWEIIEETADKTRKPRTETPEMVEVRQPLQRETREEAVLGAAQIIRRRRSATAFDPDATMDQGSFFSMLDRTLPRSTDAPFDVGLGPPAVHLAVFVHRVAGVPPGIYLLVRDEAEGDVLREECDSGFFWHRVRNGFPLFLLRSGDVRVEAIEVSCHQEIAGFSAFSVGMLGRFSEVFRSGPHRYRHLFWETGMIGQVLYLEAEARGYRGTGIGCFFDDPVHAMLGLATDTFQSLYHFTVGAPVEDPRLTTHPPYFHLEENHDSRT